MNRPTEPRITGVTRPVVYKQQSRINTLQSLDRDETYYTGLLIHMTAWVDVSWRQQYACNRMSYSKRRKASCNIRLFGKVNEAVRIDWIPG